jgi:hypothetical protein
MVGVLSWLVMLNTVVVPLQPLTPQGFMPSPTVNTMKAFIYQQNFESGNPGWKSVDLTVAPAHWHIDAFQAYGGTGKSWWVGDPALKGYGNHWYQGLDSPEIDIPATGTPILTFMQNRKVEVLSGGYPAGYNGWDGCNVRVSTDGGDSWTIIDPVSPAYNATSLFSFGFEHNEGTGIAGWTDVTAGWIPDTFDLSAYKGQKIKIRWAFASDPSWCTTDDSTFFGWQIDDINVAGVFTNNGNDTTGFTRKSLVPIGGDLWHITVDPDTAHSATHVAACDDGNGFYKPAMEDVYVSPLIHLPPSSDTITMDFVMRAELTDPDVWPDVDYMFIQISPDTGRTWYAVSNPTGDPNDTNYVYTPVDIGYYLWLNKYFQDNPGMMSIPEYAGKNVQFRIGLHSDFDDPVGMGIRFDDFVVYQGSPGSVAETPKSVISPVTFTVGPSPATATATVQYQLPKAGRATVAIYNSAGERTKTLVDNFLPAGVYTVQLNGRGLATGVYFLRLDFEGTAQIRKLVLLH